MKFMSENTITASEGSTAHRFAATEAEIKSILSAGAVLAAHVQEYLSGMAGHPMARTASFGLLQGRIIEAAVVIAGASRFAASGLRKIATDMAMQVAQAPSEQSALRIFEKSNVQNALWSYVYERALQIVSKSLTTSNMRDDDDARQVAIDATSSLMGRMDDKTQTKKVFRFFRTHNTSVSQPSEILKPMEVYLFETCKTLVSKYKTERYKTNGKLPNQGQYERKNSDVELTMEDILRDESRSVEDQVLAGMEEKIKIVRRVQNSFNKEKARLKEQISNPQISNDPIQGQLDQAMQEELEKDFKLIETRVEPILATLSDLAEKMQQVNDSRLSEEQKSAALTKLQGDYQQTLKKLTDLSEVFEEKRKAREDYQEDQGFRAREKAEKERRTLQYQEGKQGIGKEPSKELLDIDPNAAAQNASAKVLKKHFFSDNNKRTVSEAEHQLQIDDTMQMADTILPHLVLANSFPVGHPIQKDPRNGRLFVRKELHNLFPDMQTFETVFSPDPEIRASAPPAALAAVAYLKAMMVMRHMDTFERKYAVRTRDGKIMPATKTVGGAGLMKYMDQVIQKDPALAEIADGVRSYAEAAPNKEELFKMFDFYTRAGAYQWAKSEVASDKTWGEFTPEERDQVVAKVHGLVYDNDHRDFAVSPQEYPDRMLGRIDASSDEKRELMRREIARMVGLKKAAMAGAQNARKPWGASMNDFKIVRRSMDPEAQYVRFFGRATQYPMDDIIDDNPYAGDAPTTAPLTPSSSEEEVLAKRVDLLVRVGTRLERQQRYDEAARVARVVAGLLR